jgi:peptide/nickel transport system ATP-binding protein
MPENLLEVSGLEKHFPITSRGVLKRRIGAVRAVDEVDLAVCAGETLGLVGESGCGKSTLGRLVTRILEPTGGKILFEGRDISHLSTGAMRPLRRDIQMIFQDPYSSLNPRTTVGAIVAVPICLQKIPTPQGTKRAVQDLLKLVGLNPEHYNRYPHEFSGGQRQRIGSPARWRCGPSSSWPTSRSPPWTSRSRPRSSTCWRTCSPSST